MEQNISTMEKMIIDKILLPRLSKINEDEKRNLLAEYSKFLMLSKDYLQEKTGINVMIAQDSVSCVALGTGKALDNLDGLK